MKVAALDLGSNSFLCLVAEVENYQITKIYSDNTEVVRLGQELEKNKKFHPDALLRADSCLKRFGEIIKAHKPERVLAMATSAARDATNKDELFAIAKKYNIPLEIIAGEKEAEITYQGAVSGLAEGAGNLLVLDIGGGSTEFIFGSEKSPVAGESYDIGCVRLTERFVSKQPTPVAEVLAITAVVDEVLQKAKVLKPYGSLDQIIAVAGTPTSLVEAEVGKFDPSVIDGFKLDRPKLNDWLLKLTKATLEDKIKMGIPSGRADVILIGVIILLRTLLIFEKEYLTVSTRGVRFGVALEAARRG